MLEGMKGLYSTIQMDYPQIKYFLKSLLLKAIHENRPMKMQEYLHCHRSGISTPFSFIEFFPQNITSVSLLLDRHNDSIVTLSLIIGNSNLCKGSACSKFDLMAMDTSNHNLGAKTIL